MNARIVPETVEFTIRGRPGVMEATVSFVSAAADPASRMVPITARVKLGKAPASAPSSAAPLEPPRPGSFAEVTIRVGGSTEAPVVPETAVRPSERGFLAYVVEDGKAHERTLSLGLRTSDGFVEVRGGLKPGETVVIRGAEALFDGAAVNAGGAGAGASGGTGEPAPAPASSSSTTSSAPHPESPPAGRSDPAESRPAGRPGGAR